MWSDRYLGRITVARAPMICIPECDWRLMAMPAQG
jgi:hypothetical protein